MITNFFTPELNNHVQELWFQQDGATCHTARATTDLLKDTFGDRLISHKPETLDYLEDNIRRVIADIRRQMLEKVIENWTSRLDYIRASRGSPMPEIIFKMKILFQDNTRLSFCARAAGVHYRLFSAWTLVPVRLGPQWSGCTTVDEIASEAADCHLTYTMANCPQRRPMAANKIPGTHISMKTKLSEGVVAIKFFQCTSALPRMKFLIAVYLAKPKMPMKVCIATFGENVLKMPTVIEWSYRELVACVTSVESWARATGVNKNSPCRGDDVHYICRLSECLLTSRYKATPAAVALIKVSAVSGFCQMTGTLSPLLDSVVGGGTPERRFLRVLMDPMLLCPDCPLTASPHKSLNSSRGVISEPGLLCTPEAEMLEGFSGQGVIQAGYLNCKIRPYIPNPLRCFKCQRFGHSQTSCRGQLTCSRCASVEHSSKDCTLKPKCFNCSQSHSSDSKLCPKWKIEKQIQEIKTNNNISYQEARKLIASQLSQTYAQTAKSSPISAATQTDENITKIKCPHLNLLQPLSYLPKPNISQSTPAVTTSSSSTQAQLLPSTSSMPATVSEPQPPTPVSDVILSSANTVITPTEPSSSIVSTSDPDVLVPSASTTTHTHYPKQNSKTRARKRKKNYRKNNSQKLKLTRNLARPGDYLIKTTI
ncbi:uncharacterized protein TNCV_268631 [Trichonephila clavipes]|nr:uncharacterized protein TNCV_268631 [Trichonephila clavipes]